MRTLVLSNYLRSDLGPDIVFSSWEKPHPSPADFPCVILDMRLANYTGVDTPEVGYGGYPFYGVFDEVSRLLQSGGVAICLNYYTFANKGSDLRRSDSPAHRALLQERVSTFSYEYKYRGPYETSYDWLDLGFLQCTQLDRINVRPGQRYRLLSDQSCLRRYFNHVREYQKIIHGVSRSTDESTGLIRWHCRRDPEYEHTDLTVDTVTVLAVTKTTDEPIAAAINYRGWPGTLLVLPTYTLSKEAEIAQQEAISISLALEEVGKHYYELGREKLGIRMEVPPWLLKYRAKPAVDADKELGKLEAKKHGLLAERDRYDAMLALINGYGEPLEKVVGQLFGKEWLGFDVERTVRGDSIDLFVSNPRTGQRLAIQVTGVVGKFTQADKHFGAIMQYLPAHEENNAAGPVERIVLVVNTFRDTPLDERSFADDISQAVRNLVTRNEICLIRSSDLYHLWSAWVDSPEKLSADDIFAQLFECHGLWRPGEGNRD